MWGAIIGAGISLIGSMKSGKQASKAADQSFAAAQYTADTQLKIAEMQQEQALKEWEAQQAWNKKSWEAGLDERDFSRGVYSDNQALQREMLDNQYFLQNYYLNRQNTLDDHVMFDRQMSLKNYSDAQEYAARERQFAIDQYLRSQGVASDEYAQRVARQGYLDQNAYDERQYAMGQFEWAKSLAELERQYDERVFEQARSDTQEHAQFSRDQLYQAQQQLLQERQEAIANQRQVLDQLSQEREFDVELLRENQALAQEEAALDQELRNLYLTQVNASVGKVQDVHRNLGTMAQYKRYGESDVAGRHALLSDKYQQLADRAVERVASTNEANLIRRGMDNSTAADIARGAVAEQAASTYIDAETRAYNEALAQIQGLNQMAAGNEQAELARRANLVQEAMNANLAPLEYLTRAPQTRSGIYDRAVGSAARYFDSPSAMYTQTVPTGVYDRNLRSAITNSPMNIGSGVSNFTVGSANDYRAPLNIGSGFVSYNGAPTFSTPSLNAVNAGGLQYGGVNLSTPQVTNMGSQGYTSGINALNGVMSNHNNMGQYWGNQALNSGNAWGQALSTIGSELGSYFFDS